MYRICIAGGGSTYTPGIVLMLLKNKDYFPVEKIVLYDNNSNRQETIAKACEVYVQSLETDVDFSYTTDPKAAFSDIDFVFCHIRTGLYDMRDKDEKIPFKYGVYGQETCGPGGIAYGMRSIGDIIQLIDYMEEFSPHAWMLNYSNPAAIVAEATRVLRPNSRIINICDMPIGLEDHIARILNFDSPDDLDFDYYGLNHFGWFTKIQDKKSNDMMPELRKHVDINGLADAEKPDPNDMSWYDSFVKQGQCAQLDKATIPTTYLEYYFFPDELVAEANPTYTRTDQVRAGREKQVFSMCKKIVDTGKAEGFEPDDHATYIIDLAHALMDDNEHKMILIIENNGAITNFDDDAMVEIPCLVSKNGIKPLPVGEIPTFQRGLMFQQNSVEKLVVQAWIEGSYQKLLQALTLSATVPGAGVAKKILDELIEANKDYWPTISQDK